MRKFSGIFKNSKWRLSNWTSGFGRGLAAVGAECKWARSAKQRATRQSIAALPFEFPDCSTLPVCLSALCSPHLLFLSSLLLSLLASLAHFQFYSSRIDRSLFSNSPRFSFIFPKFIDFFCRWFLKKFQIKLSVREAH